MRSMVAQCLESYTVSLCTDTPSGYLALLLHHEKFCRLPDENRYLFSSNARRTFETSVERIAVLLGFPTYTKYSAGTAILGVSVELVALLDAAIVVVLLLIWM